MPFIRLPDGTVAHIRQSRPRSRRCSVCDGLTPPARLRECDFKLPNGKTCDRLLCSRCTQAVGTDVDYCPDHAHAAKEAEHAE